MAAIDLFHAGDLDGAIEAQFAEVRARPADARARLFLVELLGFTADLDRARRQLDAIALGEPRTDRAVRDSRDLLQAEAARRAAFAGGEPPQTFAAAPESLTLRLEAFARLNAGATAEAVALLARADEAITPLPGTLDGRSFTALRDTDDLLGGVLEVLALGKYYWVPLEQVVGLAINAPRYPRDLSFIAARLELAEESGEVFLPALYPGAAAEADLALKLGRLTQWRPGADGGPSRGVGAKVYQVDDDDVALIDWRQLARAEAPAAEVAAT